jgi:diguanylate cyclase (GGDEF)-like protein
MLNVEADGAALWPEFKDEIFAQLSSLEQSLAVLMNGEPNPEEQQKAQRDAHKLAGSLGSLGFPHGTELARQVDQALKSEAALSQSDYLRIRDSVATMRRELERGPAKPDAASRTETVAGVEPAHGHDLEEIDSKTSIWYLDRLVRLATRRQERLCVVVLDLDDIQHIISQYGRPTGDRIYRRLNQLLMGAFRVEDVVTRWHGDEFVVGLYGIAGGDAVQRFAELLETFRQEEFNADSGDKFRVTFSAGIAQGLKDGPDLQSLYCTAREAMTRARKMGGERILTSSAFTTEGQAASGPNVVVVDDDETLGSLLRQALTTRGYRPVCFQDGRTALEKLGGPSPAVYPQVLLLDVDLPNMDGLSVLQRLSEEGLVKRTRVIMLTAHSNEAEVVKALEWGAFDYIAKPFSLRALIQRIRRAMEVSATGKLP